jgi:ferredoxin-like protein FixX
MDTIFGAGAYKARSRPLSAPFPFNSKGEIVRKFQVCPKPVLETAIRDVTRILFKDSLECGTAELCGKYEQVTPK